MGNWKYSYDPVSKDEWIRLIEKDLKQASIESLHREWWPGESVFPLHHKEDLNELVSLPDNFFSRAPLIIEWINTANHDKNEIRRKLLQALKYGAQSIIFQMDNNDIVDFNFLLKDVFTEMLELSIQVPPEHLLQDSFRSDLLPPGSFIRIPALESDKSYLKSVSDIQKQKDISPRLVYSILHKENWIEEVIRVFRLMKSDYFHLTATIGHTEDDFFKMCILNITPDNSYLKQIIQTRVLQLLWLHFSNLRTTKTKAITSPLECHIKSNGQTDPDNYLMASSTSVLAAALTGVRGICVHQLEGAVIPIFYERINRNTNHLLNMESDIYKGVDPLAGAYTIDYYTRKWIIDCMNQLEA